MMIENSDINMNLKSVELEMLRYFLQICEEHNLRYFLLGGSCLGAVRHQGFIPWDDDIDIGMPREDYEAFLLVAQDELPEFLFLQTAQTDPEYPNNFLKIRNSMTTFIETSVKNFKMNHGVYIDVFPLDGYGMNRCEKFINFLLERRLVVEFLNQENRNNFIFTVAIKFIRFLFPKWKKARDKRDKLMRKYQFKDCEVIANYCGAWGNKEIMPKEYFGNGTPGLFEEISVVLPEKTDLYLTKLYGQYMELPPEEKRVSHHYCELIDLNTSYKKYLS